MVEYDISTRCTNSNFLDRLGNTTEEFPFSFCAKESRINEGLSTRSSVLDVCQTKRCCKPALRLIRLLVQSLGAAIIQELPSLATQGKRGMLVQSNPSLISIVVAFWTREVRWTTFGTFLLMFVLFVLSPCTCRILHWFCLTGVYCYFQVIDGIYGIL